MEYHQAGFVDGSITLQAAYDPLPQSIQMVRSRSKESTAILLSQICPIVSDHALPLTNSSAMLKAEYTNFLNCFKPLLAFYKLNSNAENKVNMFIITPPQSLHHPFHTERGIL
jgi:hypothetical protein